ncbi:chondroitin AC/alginate lyase [Aspergillus venezuelensis]
MKSSFLISHAALAAAAITHPGLLHTNTDFQRIAYYVNSQTEPQYTGWNKLAAHADSAYTPSATETVCRGTGCDPQNYPSLYRDIASAYANAVYWKVTGETANADAAAAILDAWSSTLTTVTGSSDKFLASGLYGYQMANAAEILRDYEGWDGLQDLIDMMQTVFLPMNVDFLVRHNDAEDDHYWANWDLCNLASLHAIGALGQGQEAGRDQGHSLLDFGLLGVLAQQAYNQGEDLFAWGDSKILAGAEYVFKYNTNNPVPFSTYTNVQGTSTEISESGRGTIRPIAELLYAHYNGVKGLNASWTGAYRDLVTEDGDGAEGGGGDYGSTSGGYDSLGFGTALFRLD